MCFKALNGPFRLGVQMHFYICVGKKMQRLGWQSERVFKLTCFFLKRKVSRTWPLSEKHREEQKHFFNLASPTFNF